MEWKETREGEVESSNPGGTSTCFDGCKNELKIHSDTVRLKIDLALEKVVWMNSFSMVCLYHTLY